MMNKMMMSRFGIPCFDDGEFDKNQARLAILTGLVNPNDTAQTIVQNIKLATDYAVALEKVEKKEKIVSVINKDLTDANQRLANYKNDEIKQADKLKSRTAGLAEVEETIAKLGVSDNSRAGRELRVEKEEIEFAIEQVKLNQIDTAESIVKVTKKIEDWTAELAALEANG